METQRAEALLSPELSARFQDFAYDRVWIEDALRNRRTRTFLEGPDPGDNAVLCPAHGICFLSNPRRLDSPSAASWLGHVLDTASEENRVRYISFASEEWVPVFQSLSGGNAEFVDRVSYELSAPSCGDIETKAQRICHQNLKEIASEVDPALGDFWPGLQDFVEKSIGFYVQSGGRIQSVAWSAFEPRNDVEIAVATRKSARGNGHAYAACTALLDYCRSHYLRAHWTTAEGNEAARRLAVRLGFLESTRHRWYRCPTPMGEKGVG
jgi:GNAT superfamily N-acetyltransferase